MRKLAAVLVVCAALPLTGCGPILSTYLILSAKAELEGAKAAEAEKYAVYEYTAASEYLHKAREEQGFADYGPSIDYAFKAEEMAKKCTEKSNEEKKKFLEQPGATATWDTPVEEGSQPGVIIKKKDDNTPGAEPSKVKVVPIPVEEGPKPKG
jgi:Domain of unknown function (DUF4398)